MNIIIECEGRGKREAKGIAGVLTVIARKETGLQQQRSSRWIDQQSLSISIQERGRKKDGRKSLRAVALYSQRQSVFIRDVEVEFLSSLL